MAALLRQAARRMGGSVLQRTQAAVTSPAAAEERPSLVPRRMTTDAVYIHTHEAMQVQQKKEDLYDALSKTECLRDRAIMQDLIGHIKPRPQEEQWRRLRKDRKTSNFIEITGTVIFVNFAVVLGCHWGEIHEAAVKRVAMERENQGKKRVAMERESHVERLMEKQG